MWSLVLSFFIMHFAADMTCIHKNKNIKTLIFKRMSGHVGFLPPPTYFLHTLFGLLHAIVNYHSVYVGSMWVGVRILHSTHFFENVFILV